MSDKYILDENDNPIPEPDLMKWAKSFQKGSRLVAKDEIGDVLISTVFLGLDHNFGQSGPPILWETIVFGGAHDQDCDRCAGTRADAMAMHGRMLAKVAGSEETP
jgi:hypothetical protein